MLKKKRLITIITCLFLVTIVFAQENLSVSQTTEQSVVGEIASIETLSEETLSIETEQSQLNKDPYTDFPFAIGMYEQFVPTIEFCGGLHIQRWFNKFGLQFSFGGIASDTELNYSVVASTMLSLFRSYISENLNSDLYIWFEVGHHGFKNFNDILIFNEIVGIGVGLDIVLFDHFSIPLEFGYGVEFPQKFVFGFCASTGFRYRF